VESSTGAPGTSEVAVRIVDCDVHPFGDAREIAEYVPEPWRSRYYRDHVNEVELNASLYTPPDKTTRVDSVPPGGGVPGGDRPSWSASCCKRRVSISPA
jgi:hypothetical protein